MQTKGRTAVKTGYLLWSVGLMVGCWTTVALGQRPTFSVVIAEVNGVEPFGGPTANVVVAPGDRLVARIYLRDWAPEGQGLRGYQVTVDPASYTSGASGRIVPAGFDEFLEVPEPNRDADFTDVNDADYIFLGQNAFVFAGSVAEYYRWLGALVD